MARIKDAAKIRFQRLPKFVARELFYRLAKYPDSGVIYQNVDAAEPTFAFANEHSDLVLISDVAQIALNLAVLRKPFDCLVKVAFVSSADKDRRPVFQKRFGD